jgi:hypothetical protein
VYSLFFILNMGFLCINIINHSKSGFFPLQCRLALLAVSLVSQKFPILAASPGYCLKFSNSFNNLLFQIYTFCQILEKYRKNHQNHTFLRKLFSKNTILQKCPYKEVGLNSPRGRLAGCRAHLRTPLKPSTLTLRVAHSTS